MNTYDIRTICDAMGGRLESGPDAGLITAGVSTDTRTIEAGSLFVALKGERFDGHDFLSEALGKGAAGVVVSRPPEAAAGGSAAVIVVADTLLALQRLARWYRRQLDVVVVGITGSNGKTSTKDLTASVLRQRYAVHATAGNFNNHIGLPLTILAADDEDELLVLEMGMNHPGEIALLCEIGRPHLGVITNIGLAHLEHMGSREAIAEEKGALARFLPEVGTLVLPVNCEFADYLRSRTAARTVLVGNSRGEVRAEELELTADGSRFELVVEEAARLPVRLPAAGRHMVTNALMAAAIGQLLGLRPEELVRGLEQAKLTGGRLRRYGAGGITVFDDTYNANPGSVLAAVEALAGQEIANGGEKIIVLGAMAELGRQAEDLHRQVGSEAAKQGLRVVSVGAAAAGIARGAREAGREDARHFDDPGEAAKWLEGEVRAGDRVLFKGSRTARMEELMHRVFPED